MDLEIATAMVKTKGMAARRGRMPRAMKSPPPNSEAAAR